ncbi:MAG: efflux RND transporter periplasmic adaptor subunit, partial [Planctomycetota bacterium]
LATVGWLGHATHWTFGLGGGHASHGAVQAAHAEHADHADHNNDAERGTTAEPFAVVQGDPAPGQARERIEFQSREMLDRTGIELIAVQRRTMVSELLVTGVVQYDARRTAELSTRVSGSVWRVEKHLGDTVHEGDVLLVVESRDVGRLKAEFLNAMVAFEARREQFEILQGVQGAVLGRQLREAISDLREARNHLTIAEQELVNLGLRVSIADYMGLDDDARATKLRTLGIAPELLAGIDPVEVSSNLLPLCAPFAGVVIGRDAVVGEFVEAGEPIFEVTDVSTMWVILNVVKEDAAKVALGQAVRFFPDGSTEVFPSRISWISTDVNSQTRTLQVRAEIHSAAAPHAQGTEGEVALKANTFGSGFIELKRHEEALVVPRNSVQWDGRRWVVFVPAGDLVFEPRAVRLGLAEGGQVEILADFGAAGPPESVVGQGSHVLTSQVVLDRLERGEPDAAPVEP